MARAIVQLMLRNWLAHMLTLTGDSASRPRRPVEASRRRRPIVIGLDRARNQECASHCAHLTLRRSLRLESLARPFKAERRSIRRAFL